MKKYKLGVGPMSREIVECINEYGETTSLMVVASRNQVDYNSGYVCSSRELSDLIPNPNILVCRDHCGPYFSDADKKLSLSEALEECKKTIYADIKAGFDLIHIDVSRIEHHQLEYAKELIECALSHKPDILMEFGSEDNTGEGLGPSLSRITEQLEFIAQYKKNIKFFVTQTGSFTQHMQMGTFDIAFNKKISEKIHSSGFLFKEHNADYLSAAEVQKRRLVSVDALNIAPQLGTVQTRILQSLSYNNKEWYEFSKKVLAAENWKKWLPRDVNNKDLAVIVAGHYHFNTIEYKRLMNTIDVELFKSKLRTAIFDIFDIYTKE